jgi:hypothetical protein
MSNATGIRYSFISRDDVAAFAGETMIGIRVNGSWKLPYSSDEAAMGQAGICPLLAMNLSSLTRRGSR